MKDNRIILGLEGENDKHVLIIREGEALSEKEPEKIVIDGTIDTVFRYLEKRSDCFDHKKAIITIGRDGLNIKLRIDESNYYGSEIFAGLALSKEFCILGINSGKQYSTFKLADLIKMNRSFFESKEVAMQLVSELKNFKAKVDRDIELSTDDRANYTVKKNQAVESNIPDSFKVNIPIFKGQPAQIFEVEVAIDSETFECQLISPTAKDIINEISNALIDEQIKKIKELCPDIALVEV